MSAVLPDMRFDVPFAMPRRPILASLPTAILCFAGFLAGLRGSPYLAYFFSTWTNNEAVYWAVEFAWVIAFVSLAFMAFARQHRFVFVLCGSLAAGAMPFVAAVIIVTVREASRSLSLL